VNTQLLKIEGELEDTQLRAHHLAATVTEQEWSVRPPSGGWSVAECVIHLNITARETLAVLRPTINEGREDEIESDGPYRLSMIGGLLVWLLEPPYRRRFKTAAPFQPDVIEPKPQVMEAFDHYHDEMSACLREADGLDLTKLRIVSPFDKRVKYNLYTAFRLLPTHERRHLWQAEKTIAAVRRAQSR
jgi:hypothetical protein